MSTHGQRGSGRTGGRRSGSAEVHQITSAPEPLTDDVARRQRRYLVQMGIRVVCFALSVLTWGHIPVVLSLVLIVGAVVLPYTAVLIANAGRERRDTDASFMEHRELGPGHHDGGELGDGR